MAVHGESSESGSDFGNHLRTWKGFTSLIKWSIAGIGVLMLLLAIFRTHG